MNIDSFQMKMIRDVVQVTIIILAFAPVTLSIIIGLLKPGRKGYMRTTREILFENTTPEAVRKGYEERLRHEGFTIEQSPVEHKIVAMRSSGTSVSSPFSVHTHASKALKAEVHFDQRQDDVAVRLTVSAKDFVIMDTGEGRYIDETIDRLLSSDLRHEPPPVVPNQSHKALTALYTAFLMYAAPLVMLLVPGFNSLRSFGLLCGIGAGFFICLILALFGIYDVRTKPKEMTGTKQSVGAILLGLGAVVVTAGVFLVLHSEQFFQLFE